MDTIQYQGVALRHVIDQIPDAERNLLPFGCVKLDKSGVILEYNVAEAEITGAVQKDVLGKNFFYDVATCTQRPEFYGVFRQAMEGTGFINQVFYFEFQNPRYSALNGATRVKIHMFSSVDSKGKPVVWLLVKRASAVVAPAPAPAPALHDASLGSPSTSPAPAARRWADIITS